MFENSIPDIDTSHTSIGTNVGVCDPAANTDNSSSPARIELDSPVWFKRIVYQVCFC